MAVSRVIIVSRNQIQTRQENKNTGKNLFRGKKLDNRKKSLEEIERRNPIPHDNNVIGRSTCEGQLINCYNLVILMALHTYKLNIQYNVHVLNLFENRGIKHFVLLSSIKKSYLY